MQRADVAMYRGQARPAPRARCTRPSTTSRACARLALLGELRSAMHADELVLHYQPMRRLATGALDGVEALVRWQHPEHGLCRRASSSSWPRCRA